MPHVWAAPATLQQERVVKNPVKFAVLCVGTALVVTTAAQAQQPQQLPQQPMGQQFGVQQPSQQMPGQQMPGQQMPGQMPSQQQLTQQSIQNFFQQAQNVLQQTARTQDPQMLRQYLDQYVEPGASFTSISQLFLGDRHVATTVSEATDEMISDALGYAANALQGRKLVSNYEISINVRDIDMSPNQQSARVETTMQERGTLTGPIAERVASRAGQMRERLGEMRQQRQGQDQQQMGQLGQRLQQRWSEMQSDQGQGGVGMGAGGGMQTQGIQFQSRANCTHEMMLDQGQLKLGNTFCRATMRLGQ